MRNKFIEPVIKKLTKRSKKICTTVELKTILSTLMWDEYADTKAYKIIYYLKNKWYLYSLKKNILLIKQPDEEIDELALTDQWYRTLLAQQCKDSHWANRYIWWYKALQLTFSNNEVIDSVLIVNEKKQWTEAVMFDQTIQLKKYTSSGESLFKLFRKFTSSEYIGKTRCKIADKELAILETLFNADSITDREQFTYVKKIIKKTKVMHRDSTVWKKILLTWKHHTSLHRLYEIAHSSNKDLATIIDDLLKKYSFQL